MREWTQGVLADVADIRPSNVDKLAIQGEHPVRLCNYMDVYANERITSHLPFMAATATGAEIMRFRVEAGDVMLTKDSETPDDIGIPAVVSEAVPDLVCGYHLALLKPRREKIDPAFLAKQLGSSAVASYFARVANGSTRYGLSYGAMANAPLQWPELRQQRRIAQILSTLDEAIEQTEALIAKTQAIKAGLMHDLFTRGVTANGELRPPREEAPQLYKWTPLGWIPKEWSVEPCAALTELITVGIVVRPVQYYVAEGIPAFRSANIRENGICANDLVFISPRSNALLAKSRVQAGDVLSVRTGYPGTSAVVPSEFEGANCIDILISRPSDRLRSHFLAAWINSSFGKEQVLRKQGGLAQQHFNVGELRDLLVAVPGLPEQDNIFARIDGVNTKLSEESGLARMYSNIRRGLMHDLLTGRVPVPLPEPEALAAEA